MALVGLYKYMNSMTQISISINWLNQILSELITLDGLKIISIMDMESCRILMDKYEKAYGKRANLQGGKKMS